MPVVLVALAVVAMIGGSLPVVILALGLLKWDRFAVVMRSATQQVRALDYVAAARGRRRLAGCASSLGEILPNVLPHLIVVATVEAGEAILLEAALSFLGLGVQPPLPSWGLMIAEAKSLHVLLVLADRHSGHGARRPRARHQPGRRRPARRVRARGPRMSG